MSVLAPSKHTLKTHPQNTQTEFSKKEQNFMQNRNYVQSMPPLFRIKRRKVLSFVGGAAAVSLFGCRSKSVASASAEAAPKSTSTASVKQTSPEAANLPACVVRPQQTEGPYFVEEGLNRSDIRSDPSNGTIKAGVPLRIAFRVSQVSANVCIPLEGAVVDIWHCDAEGRYSDVTDRSFSTVGQKFLRGSQTTGADGMAEFITIYPGWYSGRAVHVHFKIRSGAQSQRHEFTSQLYFDDALTDQVHAQSPYSAKGQRDVRNERDHIYQRGGDQLRLQLIPASEGYAGTFDIGLEMA
jgi:protocatechuate 3,4-dioxygenase beta subunit